MKLKSVVKYLIKKYVIDPLNNVKLRRRLVLSSIVINIFLVQIGRAHV